MMRLCWRWVDVLSQTLDPDERDAVRGDFAESGENGASALRDMLGLVARRQAALWNDWRPWLALIVLIVPLAMLLSIVARVTAGQSATYIWLYANNWDWAILKDHAFWYPLADAVTLVFLSCLTLVCWSWTAGFVLGSISRKIAWVYGALFCFMLVFGGFFAAPRYLAYFFQDAPGSDTHDPISALAFYRVMFPTIVQTALVAVPSLLGMRQGADVRRFTPLLRIVLWTAAIGTLTMLVIQEPGLGFFLNVHWQPGMLRLVVYWPVAYLVASAIWRRWHGRAASI